MHNQQESSPQEGQADQVRLPYVKPEIQRVDLALEETLSAGCKLSGVCDADPFDPEGGQAGS